MHDHDPLGLHAAGRPGKTSVLSARRGFKETPLWLRWMSAMNPEEHVFEAPKDTGRFSGHEYLIFLELFRVLAEHFPSLEAEIHGHVDSGIRKFDLGGFYDLAIKNGEVDESFTGIP